jgi:hypothetical protein
MFALAFLSLYNQSAASGESSHKGRVMTREQKTQALDERVLLDNLPMG